MAKTPKRIQAFTGDRNAVLALDAAIKAVRENAKAKFDESIEIAVNLGVDPRHADQQVRGVVNLPSGTGRDVRVAVFARAASPAPPAGAARHKPAGRARRAPPGRHNANPRAGG